MYDLKLNWVRADKAWSEYPEGTHARESSSGLTWEKTGDEWEHSNGDTFPRPGAANQVKFI